MSIEKLYEIYLQYPSVKTDTRTLTAGDLFFALKGDNFNGNQFAQQALEKGAAFAIIDEAKYATEKTILVADVLTTLQALAKHHRQQLNIPVIAITGSNGKTTTKELVHQVLSTTFKTYTTEGNLNNHIGIPLTLLKIKKDAEIAVIEMGANHLKEIASYCAYTQPTHGIISNCGKAHLEGFGSEEGVRKGKGELFDYLRANNGTAFVMWDYDYLRKMSEGIPTIITYGTTHAQITGAALKSDNDFLKASIENHAELATIQTHLVGDYNLPNVLAAVAVGNYFSIADGKIKKALENYLPTNSRSQLIKKGSNEIILDAYNANPSSMKLAIENFAKLNHPKKVVIIGAMAELGVNSLAEHQQIISLLEQHRWEQVVLVGGDFLTATHSYLSFTNSAEAKEWFRAQGFENTAFLIKGSRSSKMEKVMEE